MAVSALPLLALAGVAVAWLYQRGKQIEAQRGELVPEQKDVFAMIETGNPWTPPAAAAPYLAMFAAAEAANGIPHNLLVRVAKQESNFDPRAHNAGSNASGMMQIVPYWHPGIDPYNVAEAIPYAGRYLAQMQRQFGTWSRALAAYNWGPGNLEKHLARAAGDWREGMPRETRNYVAQITADVPVQ